MSRAIAFECIADFSDDCLWDEDGENAVQPNGMALTQAVVDLVGKTGIWVGLPTMDLEHHSWIFDVQWRGENFWVQITHLDRCYIHIHGGPWFLSRLFSRKVPRKADLAEHIGAILAGDPRFAEIKPYDVYA